MINVIITTIAIRYNGGNNIDNIVEITIINVTKLNNSINILSILSYEFLIPITSNDK